MGSCYPVRHRVSFDTLLLVKTRKMMEKVGKQEVAMSLYVGVLVVVCMGVHIPTMEMPSMPDIGLELEIPQLPDIRANMPDISKLYINVNPIEVAQEGVQEAIEGFQKVSQVVMASLEKAWNSEKYVENYNESDSKVSNEEILPSAVESLEEKLTEKEEYVEHIELEENIIEEENVEPVELEENKIEEEIVEPVELEENVIEEEILEPVEIDENIIEEENVEPVEFEEQAIEEENVEPVELEKNIIEEENVEPIVFEEKVIEEENVEPVELEENVIKEENVEPVEFEEKVIEEENVETIELQENGIEEEYVEPVEIEGTIEETVIEPIVMDTATKEEETDINISNEEVLSSAEASLEEKLKDDFEPLDQSL